MRFMILVKANTDSEAGVMPTRELLAAMGDYHEQLAKAGVLVDASGLQATSKGWRVKYSNGGRNVIDGPFIGAKDLIAGYTIIQTKTKEEAVEWINRYPNPSPGDEGTEIEVRLMFELEDFDDSEEIERLRKLDTGTAS